MNLGKWAKLGFVLLLICITAVVASCRSAETHFFYADEDAGVEPGGIDGGGETGGPALTSVIGGVITGLAGEGLTLRNNGGDDLKVGANGPFAFVSRVPRGSNYEVTVATQPTNPSQTCAVANGSGKADAENIVNIVVTCTTSKLVVGGSVTGMVGTGLVLQNNLGDNLPVSGNGPFQFATPIASGSSYNVTVATQPSSPSQNCAVKSGTGVMGSVPVTTVVVDCSTSSFSVGGTVSGLIGTNLVLQNNGGDNVTVNASGIFTFPTPLTSGASFAVTILTQPTAPNQTCTVSGDTGTVGGSNVSSVVVNCATNSYTIGGTVSGLSGSGLVLQNNGGNNRPLSGNGTYAFTQPIASGGAYNVTVLTQPTTPSQTCTVSNGFGIVPGANVTTVGVSCTTNSFNVGGTINGLTGTGLQLTLTGGTPSPSVVTINAGTSFTFPAPVLSGGNYTVAVTGQPSSPTQSCSIPTPSGTMGNGNASVTVNCTTSTFTVGGTVTGLSGGGLVLQNNGGNNLSVNGSGSQNFTFTTQIASGQSYNVSVLSNSAGQICEVASGAGTVTTGPIANVQVHCRFVETFDALVAPNLPATWTTSSSSTQGPAPVVWRTVTHTPPSSPSQTLALHVFAPNAANGVGGAESVLVSRSYTLVSNAAVLRFWHWYNTELSWDGGVLEMKIGAGVFQDITASAGASFGANGYSGSLNASVNPIASRQAWTGNSTAYVQTVVNLAGLAGQTVQFRWRMGADDIFTGAGDPLAGWHIDTVDVEP